MKTHCKFGHPRTPENLRGFTCKTCERERQTERQRRYFLHHPEAVEKKKMKTREWKENNKEKHLAHNREIYPEESRLDPWHDRGHLSRARWPLHDMQADAKAQGTEGRHRWVGY